MESSEQEPANTSGHAGHPAAGDDIEAGPPAAPAPTRARVGEGSALGEWFARRSPGQRMGLFVAALAVVAAIAVPLALSGGGGRTGNSQPYPANVRTNFLTACETNASTAICQCAFQKIQSQVTLQQFKQDELSYERSGKLPPYYTSVVFSCLGH
jgi:hypothetical protein